jgi:hypothetical protein
MIFCSRNLSNENKYVLKLFGFFFQIEVLFDENHYDILFSDKLEGLGVLFHKTDLKREDLRGLNGLNADNIQTSNFLNLITHLLLDSHNSSNAKKVLDRHDRLLFNSSVQFELDLNYPLVNKTFSIFKTYLEKYLGKSFNGSWLPHQAKAVVLLSHDVDNPYKYPVLYNTLGSFSMAETIKSFILYLFDANRFDHWTFEKLVQIELSYGFRSTFFFQSKSRFSKGSSSNDVTYRIDNKRFRHVFETLVNRGFSLGLHPTYNCFQSVHNYKSEKSSMERVVNKEILFLRHHLWHYNNLCPSESFQFMDMANFRIDSSLAFNDHYGYRRSVALPFNPNLQLNSSLFTIPNIFMDGNYFYSHFDSLTGLKELLSKLLDELVINRGIASFNWHEYTALPIGRFFSWGQGYLLLLEMLKNRSEICVWTFDELLQHVDNLPVKLP